MIIHQPETLKKDGDTILWAALEMDKQRDHFPPYLWYRVSDQYASYLKPQSDAFLVAALLAGMHFGEDIEVRGSVSPRLTYHLAEYQTLISVREPDTVQPIEIKYNYIAPVREGGSGVGTTFSGGADSLFSIYSHLPKQQADPDYQVTHGLFVRGGFGMLPSNREGYMKYYRHFQKEATNLGMELIELETNMFSIIHKRMNGPYMFGPLLISSALALSGLFKRFYVPSSWDYHTLLHTAHASDALADGFLSTDTMDIIHHGSTHRRVEKLTKIADWNVAHRTLVVCIDPKPENDKWNCARCEKCMRTMIPLYVIDKLDRFETFQKPFQRDIDILWWARKFRAESNYFTEMFSFMRKYKPELLPLLYLTVLLGRLRYLLIKFTPEFIKRLLRRYGYFVNFNDAPDAYEVREITEAIRAAR